MADVLDLDVDDSIALGARFQANYELGQYHTANMMGGSGDVVASAVLIHLMEVCCFNFLNSARDDVQSSWGYRVSMEHRNPATVSEPLRVCGKITGYFATMVRISFEIFQGDVLIAEGEHDRKLQIGTGNG